MIKYVLDIDTIAFNRLQLSTWNQNFLDGIDAKIEFLVAITLVKHSKTVPLNNINRYYIDDAFKTAKNSM